MREKAPYIAVHPNRPRIMEAVVFLVSEADRLSKTASQYDIVKSVFLADRRHLNEFGRPITFDRYVAMKHGPVPSTVYDLLKKDPLKEGFAWHREACGEGINRFFGAKRPADQSILSQSDREALSDSFVTVKSLGFGQIRKLTHEDPAYRDCLEIECTRIPFLPPSRTGKTAISFSMLVRYTPERLALFDAKVIGSMPQDVLIDMRDFLETVTSLPAPDKDVVRNALKSLLD